jgi:hypothetical protein
MILKLESNGWSYIEGITELEVDTFGKENSYESGYYLKSGQTVDRMITINDDNPDYIFIQLKIDDDSYCIATDGEAYLLSEINERL